MFRLLYLALATTVFYGASLPQPNRYPEPHALLQEAISVVDKQGKAPAGITDPRYAIAASLLRAGYIEEARRLQPFSGPMPYQILNAQILYGDLNAARSTVDAQPNVKAKIAQLLTIANTAWRMRDTATVDRFVAEAQRLANGIPALALRQKESQIIALRRAWFREESPVLLSANPDPAPARSESQKPSFPITIAGFRHRPADDNAAYVKRLAPLIAAHDGTALQDQIDHAPGCFIKALATAALIESHVQAQALARAEEAARAMPEDKADCSLARAEALTFVGSAWAVASDAEGAKHNFALAQTAVDSVVARDLTYGRTMVTGHLAAAEDRASLSASFALYEAALSEAARLPLPLPKSRSEDPYRQIFLGALAAKDLKEAHRIAQAWRAKAGPAAWPSIAAAWFEGHESTEAITYARAIPDAWERSSTLATLAGLMLDQAGAPNP